MFRSTLVSFPIIFHAHRRYSSLVLSSFVGGKIASPRKTYASRVDVPAEIGTITSAGSLRLMRRVVRRVILTAAILSSAAASVMPTNLFDYRLPLRYISVRTRENKKRYRCYR